jgi:glycine dehydrogenase
MIAIRMEIAAIETGNMDPNDNVLKNAPHSAEAVASDEWSHPYPRELAAYPSPSQRQYKFWPPCSRIDNVFGDRNVICVCPPIEDYK